MLCVNRGKAYIVVQFCSDIVNGVYPVECMPSEWLIDRTHCYWPPKDKKWTKLKVDSAIRNRVQPDPETWQKFEILIIASSSKEGATDVRK